MFGKRKNHDHLIILDEIAVRLGQIAQARPSRLFFHPAFEIASGLAARPDFPSNRIATESLSIYNKIAETINKSEFPLEKVHEALNRKEE